MNHDLFGKGQKKKSVSHYDYFTLLTQVRFSLMHISDIREGVSEPIVRAFS